MAKRELEGLVASPRAVELGAVLLQRAHVMHCSPASKVKLQKGLARIDNRHITEAHVCLVAFTSCTAVSQHSTRQDAQLDAALVILIQAMPIASTGGRFRGSA